MAWMSDATHALVFYFLALKLVWLKIEKKFFRTGLSTVI